METVQGIQSAVPPLTVYPTDTIRSKVSTPDWQVFLDVWLSSIEFRLRLDENQFSNFKFSQPAAGAGFLLSYLTEYATRRQPVQSGSKEAKLHHHCYFLLKRLLLETTTPYDCSALHLFELLGAGCVVFHAISDWKLTLTAAWKRNQNQIKSAIEASKATFMQCSTLKSAEHLQRTNELTALVRCLPIAAITTVAGSDFLETIVARYDGASSTDRKALTTCLYYSLEGLLLDTSKHISLLLDVMFELKTESDHLQERSPDKPTLLSSLLCTTPFLRHIKADNAITAGKRGQSLVESLLEYKSRNAHRHPVSAVRKGNSSRAKGKAKAGLADDFNVHQASQVSEIHELFPDLPSGYILRLLDHFSNDTELTIAGLLEPESLPNHLKTPTADDKLNIITDNPPIDLAPRATPPPPEQRKNIFNNDDFDKLQISSSKIHRGRREIMPEPQTHEEHSRSKAAIMAALAAFDADDDERDDTYDVADVGGAVDNTLDSDERRVPEASEKNEEALFHAWAANPELFSRVSKTRMSNVRRQLAEETGMDNEQIEGWAIMLSRNPKLQDRLRQRYSATETFRGNQSTMASTKWRANNTASDSQDEDQQTQGDGRRMGAEGIRGARTWNRGRGRGSTSGPADDHATQMARKRKEQGRGRGGAAHRREGRAKKMGRGMGPVSQ